MAEIRSPGAALPSALNLDLTDRAISTCVREKKNQEQKRVKFLCHFRGVLQDLMRKISQQRSHQTFDRLLVDLV